MTTSPPIWAHFGSGGAAPYETALIDGGGLLRLVDIDGGETPMELARFLAAADAADLMALSRAEGAVLDVGCGPGRMVRAAVIAGHLSLGVDVSDAAIAHAQAQGLPVLHRSVFDTIPREGEWGSVLLLDGNIGIGGDPLALLRRCAELVQPGGSLIIEAHPDASRDRAFRATLVDEQGRTSMPFSWYEIGVDALRQQAENIGLGIVETWAEGERSFLHLRRPARAEAREPSFETDTPADLTATVKTDLRSAFQRASGGRR